MKKLEVGKNKQFKKISAAIDVAKNGDEIIVEPGLYSECFEINRRMLSCQSIMCCQATMPIQGRW